MAPLVLVTEPEFRRAQSTFVSCADLQCVPAPSSEEELAAVVRSSEARYVIVGSVPYRGALYAALWARNQKPGLYSMADVLGLSDF